MPLSKIKNYSKKVWKSEFFCDGKFDKIYLSDYHVDKKFLKYHKIDKTFFHLKNKFPLQYVFPYIKNLEKSIKLFHINEGMFKKTNDFDIIVADGSTPLLSALVTFISSLGFSKIYSIFPIYYSIHKICDSFNIPIIPVNNDLTHTENFSLKLPSEKSVLFLTDPLWCIGRNQNNKLYKILREWQKKTKSIIIIDSSYDYCSYENENETKFFTNLDSSNTIRLVSPTKSLGIHGVRFSYLIIPDQFGQELYYVTCSSIGSTSQYMQSLRYKLYKYFLKNIKKTPISKFSKERFLILKKYLDKNKIDYISPTCCSYVLIKIIPFLKKKNLLNKYCFLNNWAIDLPLSKYKDYVKYNLVTSEENFKMFLNDLK